MASRRPGRKFRWWLIPLAVALALIIYSFIPRPVEVRTAVVTDGVLVLGLSSTGIVESDLSDVSPRYTAKVTSLYVNEGDVVDRSQPLAGLEDDDLRAEVARLAAAVRAAEQEVDALQTSAAAQTAQLDAAAERARASVSAARERLRELESGSRAEDIAAQKAVVAQAKAEADDLRRQAERAEQLFARGAVSEQQRDTARAAYISAQAALQSQEQQLKRLQAGAREETIAAARAEVRVAESARAEAEASLGFAAARRKEVDAARARLDEARSALKAAQAQLSYATIISPFNGVVVRKHKDPGETANPLDPIYTIADLDRTWVTAEVDEEDAAAVAVGQEVRITVDAYPGRFASGKVTWVSDVAEPKEVGRVRAKIVRAKVTITKSSIPLRPGMEVNVIGSVPAGRPTLLVPNDAVMRAGDENIVFVIRNGIARRAKVRIGQSNFEQTQVLSGLKEHDRVAVTGLDQLSDGMRVREIEQGDDEER